MEQIKIGKFIAQKRKQNNMTQIEFAEKLGVTNKTVSRWENGKNMPDVSLFLPICELLNISLNELIIGEEIEKCDTNNNISKSDEVIVETINDANKKISKARLTFYIVAVIVNALFCIGVPLTASPSDAMAVPLAAVLGSVVTAVFISCLRIRQTLKFSYIPITTVLFLVGSLLYFSDSFFDYGLFYSAVIAIIQLIIFLLSWGIGKLIMAVKNKLA